jgi:hypothetical protein
VLFGIAGKVFVSFIRFAFPSAFAVSGLLGEDRQSDIPLGPALVRTAVEAKPERVHFGPVEKIHPAIIRTDQNGFRPVCEVAHEKKMGGKAPVLWKLKSCL